MALTEIDPNREEFLDDFSEHINAMKPGDVLLIRLNLAGTFEVVTMDAAGITHATRPTIEEAFKAEDE
jgi:hypothetical protein